jgi:single stranded DNA-binding protein
MANPKTTIEGNLAFDPEFKSFPNGNLLKLRVMTNDETKSDTGEWVKKDASGWNVEVWGKMADLAHDVLKKGMGVVVTGTMSETIYEDKEGKKVSYVKLRANKLGIDIFSMDKASKAPLRNVSDSDDIWAPSTGNLVEAPF